MGEHTGRPHAGEKRTDEIQVIDSDLSFRFQRDSTSSPLSIAASILLKEKELYSGIGCDHVIVRDVFY